MKQKIHLLKVSLSHTVIIFVSLLIIFRLKRAFASFSIPYPEKNIRLPHGHPTTRMCGHFRAYQVNQLLDTIRLGSPITPTGIRVVTYIHEWPLVYVLLSSNTVALRNFLPTAVHYDAFIKSSRALTLLIFLLSSCCWKLQQRLGFNLSCNPPHRCR